MKIEFRKWVQKLQPIVSYFRRFWNVTPQKILVRTMSKNTKVLSAIAATILTVLVAYCFLPTLWFWISWEIIGAILVAIGCVGEWHLVMKHVPAHDPDPNHHRREVQFVTLVAIGVTMEFLGLMHTIPEALKLERDVANAVERTSVIESNNLVLKSNVAALEIELMETSNNVTKIDPINLPIKSMMALVHLGVCATNFIPSDIDRELAVFGGYLEIVDKQGARIAMLACREFDNQSRRVDGENPIRLYSMNFSWPITDKAFSALDPFGEKKWSERDLNREMAGIRIKAPAFGAHLSICYGSLKLTINGTMERAFSAPKYSDEIFPVAGHRD